MQYRELAAASLAPYELLIGGQRMERLRAAARDALRRLGDRTIWNVNSTGSGGGVAELLDALLPLARALGIDVR